MAVIILTTGILAFFFIVFKWITQGFQETDLILFGVNCLFGIYLPINSLRKRRKIILSSDGIEVLNRSGVIIFRENLSTLKSWNTEKLPLVGSTESIYLHFENQNSIHISKHNYSNYPALKSFFLEEFTDQRK